MSAPTLEDLFAGAKRQHARGCPVCGEPNVASVAITVRELSPNGTTGGKGAQSRSRSVSLCATHSAEIYLRAVEQLP